MGNEIDWKKVVERKAWLLHTPSCIIAEAAHYMDGESEKYVSSVNNEAINDPVIKLADGNALLAKLDDFVLLEEDEAAAYQLARAAIGAAITNATLKIVQASKTKGVKPMAFPTLNAIFLSALRAQQNMLNNEHASIVRGGAPGVY